ncbi:hypothetical protein [Desulfomonile tiedjei]|uniref:XRE family transcriptional regulator n=1 Tax=Desulfomonile tiedjei (strain ATCC 49306 / DSM 6799 / DCB-1) TaxID=706587 RepID=I4C2C6_DESTA|nr:hypothetical protein [Desulfomonile tiedjei]AFM23717.1 hypothetical protein Desti_0999 [Desulfomonile tiedjei DSM 6799]
MKNSTADYDNTHKKFAGRLLLLQRPGETRSAFCTRAGIKPARLRTWLKGEGVLYIHEGAEIAMRLNVSPGWLVCGEGTGGAYQN